MRMIGICLLSWLSLVSMLTGTGQSGEKIIVINNAVLKSGKDEVGKVPAGAILIVKEVNTDWLWVQYEDKLGWINQQDIIPFSSGYEYFTDKIATTPGLGNYIYRANILIEQERWQEAVDDCAKALEYDANNIIALNNRAYCQINLKNYDAAITDVTNVISLNSTDPLAHNLWGMALVNKGEPVQATTHFDQAIELNPKFINAYLSRSICSSMQLNYEKALADLDKMLSLQPDHEIGLSYRGVANFELARFNEAIADFTQVISLNPRNSVALVNRASTHNEKGEYQQALSDIEAALALTPTNPAAYNNQGFAYQKLKKYQAAIESYLKSAELKPQFATPWRNLADLYISAEDPAFKDTDKALEAGRKSCELSNYKDWKALRNLAAVYAIRKEMPLAAKTLKQAISLAPASQQPILTDSLKIYQEQTPKQSTPVNQ